MNTRSSRDTFFNGRLTIYQHQNGYRFSVDAVILAGLACPKPADTVVDLGTGCGIIPLLLAHRYPKLQIAAVELQPELADLARINIDANGMSDRIRLLRNDMKSLTMKDIPQPADLIVCNPPYRRQASGRVNPANQKALARHEIAVTIADVMQTAARLLKTAGRLVIIYPAERTADIIHTMRQNGIEPKRLRSVHSKKDTEAKLVVISGSRRGNPGLTIERPLHLYRQDGTYTAELEALFTSTS